MSKTYIRLILIILFGFVFDNIALSWDDSFTHKDLSEYAAGNSVLSRDKGDFLKNIGFDLSLDEELEWQGKNLTALSSFFCKLTSGLYSQGFS